MKLEAEAIVAVILGAVLGTVLYAFLKPVAIDPLNRAISGQ